MSNNPIQIFIRVGGSNNSGGTVYVMRCVSSCLWLVFNLTPGTLSSPLYSTDLNIHVFVWPLYARLVYYVVLVFYYPIY